MKFAIIPLIAVLALVAIRRSIRSLIPGLAPSRNRERKNQDDPVVNTSVPGPLQLRKRSGRGNKLLHGGEYRRDPVPGSLSRRRTVRTRRCRV